MSSANFEVYNTADMSPDMWKAAAKVFSTHYGVWSVSSSQSPRPGGRVKVSSSKLQSQLIPAQGAESIYVRAMIGDQVAGHVFASRWDYQGRKVCWVTQLVVDSDFRKRGLATKLLGKLREIHPDDRGFGVLSSHPAAIRAVLRASGRGLDDVNLDMIKEHAKEVMASSQSATSRTLSPTEFCSTMFKTAASQAHSPVFTSTIKSRVKH